MDIAPYTRKLCTAKYSGRHLCQRLGYLDSLRPYTDRIQRFEFVIFLPFYVAGKNSIHSSSSEFESPTTKMCDSICLDW
jgi:hypothetical protein